MQPKLMGKYNPKDAMLSGYTPLDGTIEFFGRIHSILKPSDHVVDVGAGRGRWFHDDPCAPRRALLDIRSRVASFVGVDIDPAVLENPTTTDNFVIDEGRIPLPDHSADVIIADYVLEHVAEPQDFAAEIDRILKPGGYFAARTPGRYEYVSIAARMIGNRRHADVVAHAQPGIRGASDVFPTMYRMNTWMAIYRVFPGYQCFSYLYTSEPAYFFGRRWLYQLMCFAHRVLPRALVSNMFIFLRKPS